MFICFGECDDTDKIKILEDKGTVIYLNPQDAKLVGETNKVVKAPKSSLKMYIKKDDQTNAFQILQKILENADFWENKNTTQNALEIRQFYKYDKSNFIDLIDKQNAETTYSNLFKHIFESDSELFKKFAKDVLEINDISENYKVEREEGHIDLLITDKNNIIVIENKIKSGINGVKYDIHGDIIGSQLNEYYQYVKKYKKKNEWFFIFAPDYNQINTDKIKYIPKNIYKIIPYSRIYKFFDNLSYEDSVRYSHKIQYFYEFIYAIEKHINSLDNALEIETHKKFIRKIRNN